MSWHTLFSFGPDTLRRRKADWQSRKKRVNKEGKNYIKQIIFLPEINHTRPSYF